MNLLTEVPGNLRARRRLVLSLFVACALWPFFDGYVCSMMQPPEPQRQAPTTSDGTTWDLRSMWQ